MLFLRGNKLFGDPGSFGESLVPPWPSVAAGAMRSALLAHKGVNVDDFSNGQYEDPELGTPGHPGAFALTALHLARVVGNLENCAEPLFPAPADLIVRKSEGDESLVVELLKPNSVADNIPCSRKTPLLAILAEKSRGKPESGFWLDSVGWKKYLAGEKIEPSNLVNRSDLWELETRVGVGLDPASRRAADGALFSTQAVSLKKTEHCPGSPATVGFLVGTIGARFPEKFALRFGGDGRAATASCVNVTLPTPDFDAIAENCRCRLVLTSPGIFEKGWKPTGVSGAGVEMQFELHGVRGRLSCAAVPRAETVSGFDIARKMPKAAKRVAPTGSVYWLEDLEATPDTLRSLVAKGFWSPEAEDPARRAEGFNRLVIAAY